MKQVIKSIQPLDLEELEKDLRFVYANRSDTVDQFIEEMIPIIKYHTNKAMANYQLSLIDDLSRQLRNEIVGIVVRSKRETVVEDEDEDWQ